MSPATFRPKRPETITLELKEHRKDLLSVETILETIEEKIEELERQIVKLQEDITNVPAGTDTQDIQDKLDNFQNELKGFESRRLEIEEQREKLGTSTKALKAKERAAAEIEKKSLTELVYERRSLKDQLETGRPALGPKSQELADAIEALERVREEILDQIIPPDYEEISGKIDAEIAELQRHHIDTHELKTAVETYDKKVTEYDASQSREADKAVRNAKKGIQAVFESLIQTTKHLLATAKITETKLNATHAANAEELTERLVWIENAILKKAGDQKERDTYVEAVAKEKTINIASVIEEKLKEPSGQRDHALEMLKAIGMPLTVKELKELHAKRAKKGGYSMDKLADDLLQEVSFQIDPMSISDKTARDAAEQRLKGRSIPENTTFKAGVIELLGYALEPKFEPKVAIDGLKLHLKEFIKGIDPKKPVANEDQAAPQIERVIEGYGKLLDDRLVGEHPQKTKALALTRIAESHAHVDRKAIIAGLDALKTAIEKAKELETKGEEIHAAVAQIEKFENMLADLEEKAGEPASKEREASEATKRKSTVETERKKQRAKMEKGFADRISHEQKAIEEITLQLLDIESALKDPKKEEGDKKIVFEKKEQQAKVLDLLLQKIQDPHTREFKLIDGRVPTSPKELVELLDKKDDPDGNFVETDPRDRTKKKKISAYGAIRKYQSWMEKRGFFGTKEDLLHYPEEFRTKPVEWLRNHAEAVQQKCEHIQCADVLVQAAHVLMDYPPLPPRFHENEPQLNLAPLPNAPTEPPKPGFFEKWSKEPTTKAKVDAYKNWEASYAAWQNQNGPTEKTKHEKQRIYDRDHLNWEKRKQAAKEARDEWEGKLRELGQKMIDEAFVLIVPSPNLASKGDTLYETVADACISGLGRLLNNHHFNGTDQREMLKDVKEELKTLHLGEGAAREEILEQYKNMEKKIKGLRIQLDEERATRDQLDAYVVEKGIAKIQADDELRIAREEYGGAVKLVKDLEQGKIDLKQEKTEHETQKTELEAEQTNQLTEFDKKTAIDLEKADRSKAIEAWNAYTYDFSEPRNKTRDALKNALLAAIDKLNQWQSIQATFPDDKRSVAYADARTHALEDVTSLQTFLAGQGKLLEAGLKGSLATLKTRIEQAFTAGNTTEKELLKQILSFHPLLTMSSKKP